MEGGTRVDDTNVHKALREALANCLVHADYYGRQGLVIIKKRDSITMANPGGFRIEVDAAKSGGVSDPRNGTMLTVMSINSRAGFSNVAVTGLSCTMAPRTLLPSSVMAQSLPPLNCTDFRLVPFVGFSDTTNRVPTGILSITISP